MTIEAIRKVYTRYHCFKGFVTFNSRYVYIILFGNLL